VKLKTYLLAVICLGVTNMSMAIDDVDQVKDKSKAAAIAYNYCVVSLTRINESKDIFTCNLEVENVVNNINLRKIPDERLKDTLVSVMSFAQDVLINKTDGDFIEAFHAAEAKNRLAQVFPSPSILLKPDPFTLCLAVLQSGGTYLVNVNNEATENLKLRHKKWELDKALLNNIKYARTIFIDSAYGVFQEHNIPDSYRLTEKQIVSYLGDISEKDSSLRLKRLASKKSEFLAYPPFWYFFGKTALECSNQKLALECFSKFDEMHEGILRKDPFAAGVSMARCSLLLSTNVTPSNKEQVLLDIARIIGNSWETEWNNFLFCSFAYAQLGMYEEAFNTLDLNKIYFSKLPDSAQEMTLDAELSIAAKNNNAPRIKSILEGMHSRKVFDALYILSLHSDVDVFNKLVRSDEFIVEKKLYSGADIRKWMKTITSIYLPNKWLTEDIDLTLEIDGTKVSCFQVKFLKELGLSRADFYDPHISENPSSINLIVKTHKLDVAIKMIPVFAPRVGGEAVLSHYYVDSVQFSGRRFVYDKERKTFAPSDSSNF